MLDLKIRNALASELDQSERSRQQICQFSQRYPDMTIEDSYAIQKAWVDLKCSTGRAIKGHKIGLTSRAMQITSQITEPDFGVLLDDMFVSDGAEIATANFIVPRLEVELAFVLAQPLQGLQVTLFDVLNATDYVVPALELIDARIEQFDRVSKTPRKALDTIADNAANAAVILGGRPIKVNTVDLRWCGALLYKNGVIEESGLAAAVLNHPANGIVWLVKKLAQHGDGLAAGEVVLAGSFTRPVVADVGDVFHADYGKLGSIAVRFV